MPGVMVPPLLVRALVAPPVPPRVAPLARVKAPVPLLVPLRKRVPALMTVLPL